MARTAKLIEFKLCKLCNKGLNYKKFRKVNPLKKGQDKVRFVGWTDIKGCKRFTIYLQ